MKNLVVAMSMAGLLAVAGGRASAHPPQGPGSAAGAMQCPMDVPGTQVTVEDTKDGVALVFTTSGDAAQLRERVRAMAVRHDTMMGPGHMHGAPMVPSTAREEDTAQGARLVLTPKDPAKLAELRATARAHATQMASGHCPMRHHA